MPVGEEVIVRISREIPTISHSGNALLSFQSVCCRNENTSSCKISLAGCCLVSGFPQTEQPTGESVTLLFRLQGRSAGQTEHAGRSPRLLVQGDGQLSLPGGRPLPSRVERGSAVPLEQSSAPLSFPLLGFRSPPRGERFPVCAWGWGTGPPASAGRTRLLVLVPQALTRISNNTRGVFSWDQRVQTQPWGYPVILI